MAITAKEEHTACSDPAAFWDAVWKSANWLGERLVRIVRSGFVVETAVVFVALFALLMR